MTEISPFVFVIAIVFVVIFLFIIERLLPDDYRNGDKK